MCSSSDRGEFYLFLMTFPLEFDLLMIGVCTFIKKTKKKQKKNKKKTKKQKKANKKKQKKNEKKSAKMCLCLISYSIDFFFCCWVHHWGFG